MKIRLLTILCSFSVWHGAECQSVTKLKSLAEQYYLQERYSEAAHYYKEIVGIDPDNHVQRIVLGETLYKSMQYAEAMEHFKIVSQADHSLSQEALYLYGLSLKLDRQYLSADSVFFILLNNLTGEGEFRDKVVRQKEGCQLAIRQAETRLDYPFEKANQLNSEFNDFGAFLNTVNNELTILTTRRLKSKQYVDDKYGGFLPDLVRFRKEGSGWTLLNKKDGFSELNTPWAEGSGSFTGNGNKFYFTSCNVENGNSCKIYVSYRENGQWGEPLSLPQTVNYPESVVQHPYISQGGDTLFFVSNRKGGFGQMDIWMSLKGPGEDWSSAINLGGTINTPEDEITPYYSDKFRGLVFASKGHIGYGGFDLHLAKGISFYEPEIYNLGPPFNSSMDDVYFHIGVENGFLSSNRNSLRTLNIYQFPVSDEFQFLRSLMTDDDVSNRRRAMAKFRQLRSLDLQTFRTDDYLGYDIFHPEIKKADKIEDELEAALTQAALATNQQLSSVRLSATESFGYETSYASYSNTGTDQGYLDYSNTGTGQSYASSELAKSPYYQDDEHNSRPVAPPNFNTREILIPHYYENLYFNFGSSVLRPEAKKALDQLVKSFDPGDVVLVDIMTHTDYRGDASYNFKLSEKRGSSILAHLRKKGFPTGKVRAIAMGETGAPVKAPWYHHLYHRKADITIYAKRRTKFPKSKVFIVRQSMSLSDASRMLGVRKEELKIHNGLKADNLKTGDILRVANPNYFALDLRYLLEENDLDKNIISYTVRENEGIEQIARKFDLPEEFIYEINQLSGDPAPGEVIMIYQLESKIKAPQL